MDRRDIVAVVSIATDPADEDFDALVAEHEQRQRRRRTVAPLEPGSAPRALAWLLLIGGLVGLGAAFVLTVEKFKLLADASYVPSCSINPVLSCGSVMQTHQAAVFGFPNPLMGIGGFAFVAATGAALLAGARLAWWYWAGLQLGAVAGIGFVHWLVFQSLYRIGALCPYCMVVWTVTIPIFLYVTLRNLRAVAPHLGAGAHARLAGLVRTHGVVLATWYAVITVAVGMRFWSYWQTLL